ncbi:hypothetical protein [Micromonospora sp. DT62]|uniref:hypothetical protein n=1 Tax=Micromonospora sp. DT62 TaxID=3416521 RepID=UPI003CEE9854
MTVSTAPVPVFVALPDCDQPRLWIPGSSVAGVLIVPGIGEPRAGINYLWAELAAALHAVGVGSVRMELDGCGEVAGVRSPARWVRQVGSAVGFLRERTDRVVVVARGAGTLVVGTGPDHLLAVRPTPMATLSRLRERPSAGPVPAAADAAGPRDEDLEDLGYESRCPPAGQLTGSELAELYDVGREARAPDETWFADAPTHLTTEQRRQLIARVLSIVD